MRPGPTIISECYKCHKLFRQWTLSSGNTFTAQFWPDGFMKAPMMPEMPPLFHCPNCEEFIWRRDCKEIDEVHGYDEMKEKYFIDYKNEILELFEIDDKTKNHLLEKS